MNREQCLGKAKECVCGKREQEYGSPESNFSAIAALWTAYYDSKFTSMDVAMMMALLKIARIHTGTATEDSFVDLAGYAACGCEIATMKKAEDQQLIPVLPEMPTASTKSKIDKFYDMY